MHTGGVIGLVVLALIGCRSSKSNSTEAVAPKALAERPAKALAETNGLGEATEISHANGLHEALELESKARRMWFGKPRRKDEALQLLEKACNGGAGRSCRWLIEQDKVQLGSKESYLLTACNFGDVEGCSLLIAFYQSSLRSNPRTDFSRNSEAIQANITHGMEKLESLCVQHPRACRELESARLFKADLTDEDKDKANKYRDTADQLIEEKCFRESSVTHCLALLGVRCYGPVLAELASYERIAAEQVVKACTDAASDACANAALLQAMTERNREQKTPDLSLLRNGCELDNRFACGALTYFVKDKKQLEKWARRACELGVGELSLDDEFVGSPLGWGTLDVKECW